MTELETIRQFAESDTLITEFVPSMEENLQHAIGFSQRVGTMVNETEEKYALACAEAIKKFAFNEDMTETLRQTQIKATTAKEKRELEDLKLLYRTLEKRIRSLFQAIKTRRDER